MRVPALCIPLIALLLCAAAPPKPPVHTPSEIDLLFQKLAAVSDMEAKPIEDRILSAFLVSGSPSVDLLMSRGATALAAGDADTARKLVNAVTQVAPNYAEGWHQRGKLQAAANDDAEAIVSLQKAVTLNPRQFAAMAELGTILTAYGDKRDALKMYRKALALDPHMADVKMAVGKLAREVEGEKI
jgi:Flp pilus assembly protein TadD